MASRPRKKCDFFNGGQGHAEFVRSLENVDKDASIDHQSSRDQIKSVRKSVQANKINYLDKNMNNTVVDKVTNGFFHEKMEDYMETYSDGMSTSFNESITTNSTAEYHSHIQDELTESQSSIGHSIKKVYTELSSATLTSINDKLDVAQNSNYFPELSAMQLNSDDSMQGLSDNIPYLATSKDCNELSKPFSKYYCNGNVCDSKSSSDSYPMASLPCCSKPPSSITKEHVNSACSGLSVSNQLAENQCKPNALVDKVTPEFILPRNSSDADLPNKFDYPRETNVHFQNMLHGPPGYLNNIAQQQCRHCNSNSSCACEHTLKMSGHVMVPYRYKFPHWSEIPVGNGISTHYFPGNQAAVVNGVAPLIMSNLAASNRANSSQHNTLLPHIKAHHLQSMPLDTPQKVFPTNSHGSANMKSAFVPVISLNRDRPPAPLNTLISGGSSHPFIPSNNSGLCSNDSNPAFPSASSEGKRIQTCQVCQNHDIEIPVKGHKYACPYKKCKCPRCKITLTRRHFVKEQLKITRRQTLLCHQLSSEANVEVNIGNNRLAASTEPFPKKNDMMKDLAKLNDMDDFFKEIDSICRPHFQNND